MNQPVKVVISQRFSVPAELVYEAWLDPQWIGHWMNGAAVGEERVLRVDLEPRVGGEFAFGVERQGVQINHAGEYLELDRPDLLVFTWTTCDSRPATGRVIVEIFPRDGGCELALTHVMAADSAAFAEEAAVAWRNRLVALAGALTERANPLILKAS